MKINRTGKAFGEVPEKVLSGRARLGFSTMVLAEYKLADALERMSALGVRNVEIWADITHLDPRNSSENPAAAARQVFDSGMRVLSIHAPFTVRPDDPLEKQLLDWEVLACQTIARADYVGASTIILHPMTDALDESNPAYTRVVRHTTNALYRLSDIAAVLDIRLAVENMPSPAGGRFGRSLEELYLLVAQSGRDNLGLCLDTGHVVVNGGSLTRSLEAVSDRLFSIHMHDNLYGQPHDLHLVPGQGEIDWAGLIDTLDAIGYSGNLVLELDGKKNAFEVFTEGVRFARDFFSNGQNGPQGRREGALTETAG